MAEGSVATKAPEGIDVASFMQAKDALADSITQSLKDLSATMTGYRAAVSAEKPAIEQKGAGEGELQLIEAAHTERVRAANAEAAALFGTNKAANSFVLAGLGEEILSGVEDIKQRRADIQKRKDTGFFDDPLSFILNQVSTPFAEEALAFKEETVKQDAAIARELIARTNESFAINAAITEGDAEAKANALRKAQLGKVALEVAQSDQRLAALGLNEINVRSVLNKSQFDVANAATTMQARMVEIGLQIKASERGDQTLELQKKQFTMMEQLHKLEIEAKQGNLEAEATLVERLKVAAPVLGMTPPSAKEWKAMTPRLKEVWLNAMSDPSIVEDHMLGPNVGAAVEKVTELNAPLSPGMRQLYDKLDSIRSATIEKYSAPGQTVPWNTLTKDARINKLQVSLKEALKNEAVNIPDAGGVYSPPPVAAVVNIPAVAATEISKLLAPQARDPNNPLRAQDVLSAAMMKMQNDDMSPEQAAAEISTIYKSVMMDNNQQRQYKRFAIVPMSEAAGFKTQLSVPVGIMGYGESGGFYAPVSKKMIVDMSNQAALTTLMTRIKINTLQQLNALAPNATPVVEPKQ